MNIHEAKEEIRRAIHSYQAKDENGCYVYPISQQRPLLLIGPPGIGKSAIMQQVADECGIGLVSYTMTHHTRQSAIGLPRIVERTIDGETQLMTEYTLSEIIASVYTCMERTHVREGILFIDEINCVSETLTPVMLQFLQNKMFGTHRVPDGWLIAAAGNPPAYNRSAREFDVVTMDRVRRIDIEPELDVWLRYAASRQIHPAVMAYLKLHPERFFLVETAGGDKHFVTARGWEDLSTLLLSYESMGLASGYAQIRQFVNEESIARDFTSYYHLYHKYGEDYGIRQILDGTMAKDAYEVRLSMAREASFEERFTVIGLMIGALRHAFREEEKAYAAWEQLCRREDIVKKALNEGKTLEDVAEQIESALRIKLRQETIKHTEEVEDRLAIRLLRDSGEEIRLAHLQGKPEAFALYQKRRDDQLALAHRCVESAGRQLDHAFAFCEQSFGGEQEMLLLVTMLSDDRLAMTHMNRLDCEAFLRWCDQLMFG